MWRPEGWDKTRKEVTLHKMPCQCDCCVYFEEGASAMLEALRKNGIKMSADWLKLENVLFRVILESLMFDAGTQSPNGYLAFIPIEEENNDLET